MAARTKRSPSNLTTAVTVDFDYPLPELDLSNPVRLTAEQPPPKITFSFTPSREHGWQERRISRAEMEATQA
jgi:hypothetical protein